MKRAFWAATAASLTLALAGCGFGTKYPSFDAPAYRVEANTTAPTGQTLATVIYRDGAKMRVETQAPGGAPAVIVFDQATNAAYLLQSAPAAATPAAATPTTPGATPTAPGAAPNPNTATPSAATPGAVAPAAPAAPVGVAIRVADAEAPQPVESAWAALGAEGARSVGDCSAAGEDGHEWAPKEETGGVQRTACITNDGIVLRITEGGTVLYEVTRLERGTQDAALFGIPAGYTLVDPAAVVQSVGETIGQLDSVQGSGTAPAQPAAPTTTPPPR